MSESTDLVLSEPQQRFLPSPVEAERVWKLAQTVANTDFVPKGLRGNTAAITAAMLTGREIGIGPMHSLRAIDVIDGKPSLSAELMASLVLRAGHWLWVIESTNELCTMAGRRRDWPDRIPDQDVTWSVEDAKQAGLANKGNWQKYPRAMLRARATSELCRAVFADVVERVGYVAEELGGDPQPHVEAMGVVREVAPDASAEVEVIYADDPDPSVGGDEEAPSAEDQTSTTADVSGPVTSGQSGAGAPSPVPAPDTPYNWKKDAADRGLGSADVVLAIRKAWPEVREMLDGPGRKRWGAPPSTTPEVGGLAEVCPVGVADALARWKADDGQPEPAEVAS